MWRARIPCIVDASSVIVTEGIAGGFIVGKSLNGPDWLDVETMCRAMSALHSGEVGLTFLPVGIGSTGGLSVAASIMLSVVPGSKIPPCVSVVKNWPCMQHTTLEGHAFALLHELDFQISKVYQQADMFK